MCRQCGTAAEPSLESFAGSRHISKQGPGPAEPPTEASPASRQASRIEPFPPPQHAPPPCRAGAIPAGGMRPPPPPPAKAPAAEEPAAKRQRTANSDFVLQPEDEFLAAHPGPSKVSRMPSPHSSPLPLFFVLPAAPPLHLCDLKALCFMQRPACFAAMHSRCTAAQLHSCCGQPGRLEARRPKACA